MYTEKHIGQNIRKIRLLRGMKQSTFAKEMGIAQQNISKMEKKNKVSDEQLEQAAKIFNTTVEAIKNFDDKSVFQTNIINENQINNFNSVKDLLEYFELKLSKKEEEILELKDELAKKSSGNIKAKSAEEITTPLRKIKEG